MIGKDELAHAASTNDRLCDTGHTFKAVAEQLGVSADLLIRAGDAGARRAIDEFKTGNFLGTGKGDFFGPIVEVAPRLGCQPGGLGYVADQRALRVVMSMFDTPVDVTKFQKVNLNTQQKQLLPWLFCVWVHGAVTALRGHAQIVAIANEYVAAPPKADPQVWEKLWSCWSDGCLTVLRAKQQMFPDGQKRLPSL